MKGTVGKLQGIRLCDIRDIYLLVGECRELGRNVHAWRLHLCKSLTQLVPFQFASFGVATEAMMRARRQPKWDKEALNWGWEGPWQREVFEEFCRSEMIWTEPSFVAMNRIAAPHVARRRCEIVADDEWYRSEQYDRFFCPACLDESLFSLTTARLGSRNRDTA